MKALLTDSQVLEKDPGPSAQSGLNLRLGRGDRESHARPYIMDPNVVAPAEDVASSENFKSNPYTVGASSNYAYVVPLISPLPDLERRYRERIDELVECAGEEGVQMDQSSLNDIRSFITIFVQAGKVGIFLLDNGHFRGIQKQAVDDQVGLEFLGKNTVKMTIIRRDPKSKKMVTDSRVIELSWVAPNFLRRQFMF